MNIADVEDITMNGREEIAKWYAGWKAEYTKPLSDIMMRMAMRELPKRLPPDVLAESRKQHPSEWGVLDGMEKSV
jgi:hypothetical protein